MIKENISYTEARDLMLDKINQVQTEAMPLEKCAGRIIALDVYALADVPSFDRSPYDGYAFRAADTRGASREAPAVLRIIEEIPAGSVGSFEVSKGTAAKVLTGAKIPEGADAVVMYEKTVFNGDCVKIFSELKAGDNIVKAGEDVKKGQILARAGTVIDPSLSGTLAGQGILNVLVYKKPVAAIISTGSELVDDASEPVPEGKILNTNRYTLSAALEKDGCDTVYLGTAPDDEHEIASLIENSDNFDVIVITGGVSAGDYDLTPKAMELSGCSMLVKGVDLKPGMACCFGMRGSKPVFALSGNPSSSLINYYAVVRPCIRKLKGLSSFVPEEFKVRLKNGFGKKSKATRIIKGRLVIENGMTLMEAAKGQGNVMIGSGIGCDLMAVIPKGSGPLEAGSEIRAFMV